MFALQEINQMEDEMCNYLDWQLNIEPSALKEFETMVYRDFRELSPYHMLPALPSCWENWQFLHFSAFISNLIF
jgi:hypothetical protein